MTTIDRLDHATVRAALALASRAPSVHNSQPWRWVLGLRSIHLYADRSRWLPTTDPDARDLVLSCGAALHHLRVALGAAGVASRTHHLPDSADPDHLASVELTGATPAEASLPLASAVEDRRSDRRRYSNWPVPAGFVEDLVAEAAAQGALLRSVTAGPGSVLRAALDVAEQHRRADDGYRTETAMWTGRAAGTDGVPAANLLRVPDPVTAGRSFPAGTLDQAESTGDGDGTVLLLGTASDDRLSQLRAGEAASAVLLQATVLGLASCPLSQPLEVPAARRLLGERVLGDTLCPQLLLRVGWAPPGAPLPATPRRPLTETVERRPR